MKAQDILQFAILVSKEKSVDNKVIDYIMDKLNISDLKLFKHYLIQEVNKNKIFVQTAIESESLRSEIQKLFPNREVEIERNKSLGAGIYVIDQDNHYDLSMKNKIDQIIDNLKN